MSAAGYIPVKHAVTWFSFCLPLIPTGKYSVRYSDWLHLGRKEIALKFTDVKFLGVLTVILATIFVAF